MADYMKVNGYGEILLDSERLGRDLAPLIGAKLEPKEDGDRWSRLSIGQLRIMIQSAGYGANRHRANVSAYAPEIENKLNFRRAKWPSCTVDPSRPLDKLAAEIKRKIIDPSKPILAEVQGQLSDQIDKRAQLVKIAGEITEAFPNVKIDFQDGKGEASVYLNGGGAYLTARLTSDGGLYVDRVGSLSPARTMRFMAALAGPANG